MSILLYHGSSASGIQTLQPFTADHGKPYVYFSINAVSAAFHAARAVERPYYWVPYWYDTQGKIVYTEAWKNAFSDVFSGKTGYLYCCEADDQTLLRFPTHHSLRVSRQAVAVSGCERIDDMCAWLKQREQEGKLIIQRFDSLTTAQLSLWHGMVLEELIARFSDAAPDNPYVLFVQERMPTVWERFLHKLP